MKIPFAGAMFLAAASALASARGEPAKAPPAHEAKSEDQITDYAADTITGDWAGMRSRLHHAGLATEFIWKVDALSNVGGGLRRGSEVMGNLDSKLKLDLGQSLGWKDTLAYLHVVSQHGGKFNARHIGSWLGVSNIEVPVNTSKAMDAWIQKTYHDGRLLLLAGLYPIDSEFSVMDTAGIFVQPPYGASADLALTRGPSIFNTSSFGLRGKLISGDQTLYAQAAILDGVPGDPNNPRGTHVRFDKGDGSFAIAEIGWMPAEQGHAFELTQPGDVPRTPAVITHERFDTVSKYAAGIWRYTAHPEHLAAVDADGNPRRQPSWGAYALAERTLFSLGGNPVRRVTAFGRYSFTDGRSSAIRSALNVGVTVRGMAANREDDILGIAFTRGRFSNPWRDAQAVANIDTASGENALEITYRVQTSRKFYLQPLLQHISHPGGARNARSADILGVRFEFWL